MVEHAAVNRSVDSSSLPGAAKKRTQPMLCSLFVLPRRTRTVSSAMWACVRRAPAELCAEGANPARGSGKLSASRIDSDAIAPLSYTAANDALFRRFAPYKSARGSQITKSELFILRWIVRILLLLPRAGFSIPHIGGSCNNFQFSL